MESTIPEYDSKDSESRKAASGIRSDYNWQIKVDLWISHLRNAYIFHRFMKRELGKSQYRSFTFTDESRISRALKCYLAVLDDVAKDAWEQTATLPINEHRLGFYETYALKHTDAIDPELRKRGLIWKDAHLNLLIAFYQAFREPGGKPTDPTPKEWMQVPMSIRLARTQTDRCKNTISNQIFERERWISKHFDFYHFEACIFKDCDFSNTSFESSVFERCTFSDVLMVNARLTATAFSECKLINIDLGGAMFENVRLWYQNYFSGIRVTPFTHIVLPLLEECDLSYELAARNYGLFKSWYSDAGLRFKRSDYAFREQYCLSQSYPYGRDRLQLLTYRLLSGYNERPFRFSLWLVTTVIVFAVAYARIGLSKTSGKLTFLDSLYFSVVTFTTLGYGDITPTNNPLGEIMVVLEVTAGVIGIACLTALIIRRLL